MWDLYISVWAGAIWLTQTHRAPCPSGLDLSPQQDYCEHCSHRKNPIAFLALHHGGEGPWADGTLGPVVPKSSQLTGQDWDDGTMPGPVKICYLCNLCYKKLYLKLITNDMLPFSAVYILFWIWHIFTINKWRTMLRRHHPYDFISVLWSALLWKPLEP